MMRLLRRWLAWWCASVLEIRTEPSPDVGPARDAAARIRLNKFLSEVLSQAENSRLWILVYEEGARNSFPEMVDPAWRELAMRGAVQALGPAWTLHRFAAPDSLDGWVFMARRVKLVD